MGKKKHWTEYSLNVYEIQYINVKLSYIDRVQWGFTNTQNNTPLGCVTAHACIHTLARIVNEHNQSLRIKTTQLEPSCIRIGVLDLYRIHTAAQRTKRGVVCKDRNDFLSLQLLIMSGIAGETFKSIIRAGRLVLIKRQTTWPSTRFACRRVRAKGCCTGERVTLAFRCFPVEYGARAGVANREHETKRTLQD